MRLRPIAPDEPEHPELIELLFRTKRQSSNPEWRRLDASRSRSLALLLEFGRQGRGTIRDRFDIHRIFASGRLPDKRLFEVPAPYRDDFLIWQRYQERQYERIALYGFWVLVYEAIRAGRRTPHGICRWVQEDLERSPVLSEWLGSDPLRLTVGEAEGAILETCTETNHTPISRRTIFGSASCSPLPRLIVQARRCSYSYSSSSSGASGATKCHVGPASYTGDTVVSGSPLRCCSKTSTAGGRNRCAISWSGW